MRMARGIDEHRPTLISIRSGYWRVDEHCCVRVCSGCVGHAAWSVERTDRVRGTMAEFTELTVDQRVDGLIFPQGRGECSREVGMRRVSSRLGFVGASCARRQGHSDH